MSPAKDKKAGKAEKPSQRKKKETTIRRFVFYALLVALGAVAVGVYIRRKELLFGSDQIDTVMSAVKSLPDSTLKEQMLAYLETLQQDDMDKGDTSIENRPGLRAFADNITSYHPVVMIPGFITSGLELWQGKECAAPFFRQRIWGTASMLKLATMYTSCWLQHLEVDGLSGGDPEGIRVRSAQGLQAADYVVGGYWVWAKLIQALADIGYGPELIHLSAYDWRLPFKGLEKRDRYMTKLVHQLESLKKLSGRKAVIIAHSMGCNLWAYFMSWLNAPKPDGAGLPKSWLNEHVATVALIAGPMLGAPKVTTGLLFGESQEFTVLSGSIGSLLNSVVSPGRRRRLFRSMGSAQSVLPMGGAVVWGGGIPKGEASAKSSSSSSADAAAVSSSASSSAASFEASAPDDPPGENKTGIGAFLQRRDKNGTLHPVHSVESAIELIFNDAERSQTAPEGESGIRFRKWADTGYPTHISQLEKPPAEPAFANPLLNVLPPAPDLTIACMYGVGIPTERAYIISEELAAAQPSEELEKGDRVSALIDRDANEFNYTAGVRFVDGDLTVPVMSAAYMCQHGWKKGGPRNRAGARTFSKEYPDMKSDFFTDMMRMSNQSAAHVDIMGNAELIYDLLKMASGKTDDVHEHIVSDAVRITDELHARLPKLQAWL